MPTQADGECCLRCFCLKQGLPVLRVVNRVFVQENYNTVIACLYICLFGQWGQEGREREATKKSMNQVQRKQTCLDLKMSGKNHIFWYQIRKRTPHPTHNHSQLVNRLFTWAQPEKKHKHAEPAGEKVLAARSFSPDRTQLVPLFECFFQRPTTEPVQTV